MLPIKVSNFVSRVTILFSKSSLLSFKSEIISYMIFWVWKTRMRRQKQK
ncbi:rCG46697 [Rattus norvegicus]|uniref:RCG46697 n=1 Tax=Rattus norvegicus TaxID=10116 RepID=A6IWU9_RAT|nr:rCG46697 [Rattus norvegicus]